MRMANPFVSAIRTSGVKKTPEFERILALPTRDPDGTRYVQEMTEHLRLPGAGGRLKPQQALALYEMRERQLGAAIILPPGYGKTLAGTLAFTVLKARRAMYLCPSNARTDYLRSLAGIREAWRTVPQIDVYGFGKLSSKNGRNLLLNAQPDVIVVDECHQISNEDSGRGNRILEYLGEYPDTHLIIMTGSASNRDLVESANLFICALREGAPLPFEKKDQMAWGAALGAGIAEHERPAPGVLYQFTTLIPRDEMTSDRLANARRGFRERLSRTPGVVMEPLGAVHPRILKLRSKVIEVPDKVREAFAYVHAKGQVAEGEEMFEDTVEEIAALKQLIHGFYYRWVWPENKINRRWVAARSACSKFVRSITIDKPSYGDLVKQGVLRTPITKDDPRWKRRIPLDTRGYVEDACRAQIAYEMAKEMGGHEDLVQSLEHEIRLHSPEYLAWKEVEPEYKVVTEAVWLDTYMLDYVQQWVESTKDGLAWVFYREVGAQLALRGVPYFGGGPEGAAIIHHKGSCAASFKSHSQSKNLQQFGAALYTESPGTGLAWDQSLARLDREGQERTQLDYDLLFLCAPHLASWEQALQDGTYHEGTWGSHRLARVDLSEVLGRSQLAKKKDPLWITK